MTRALVKHGIFGSSASLMSRTCRINRTVLYKVTWSRTQQEYKLEATRPSTVR